MEIKKHVSVVAVIIAFSLAITTSIIVADDQVSRKEYDGKELSIYFVSKSRATEEKAQRLAEALGISARMVEGKSFVSGSGLVAFIDPDRFQYIPVKGLGVGEPDEDGHRTTLEAFDFEALEEMEVVEGRKAEEHFAEALKDAELNLGKAKAHVSHSTFEAVDLEGKTIAKAKLDTRISFNRFLDGIPLVGPGASISATFDGKGNVTRLRYADRELKRGNTVSILSQAEAEDYFAELVYLGMPDTQIEDLRVNAKLIYYAPPLELNTVKVIMPFYECSATAMNGKDEVALLTKMIPAVEGIEYVPSVYLDASTEGSYVQAQVAIKGGTPPYRIDWSSSSTPLHESGRSIKYRIKSRSSIEEEIVMVTVTDANGVSVKDAMRLDVYLPAQKAILSATSTHVILPLYWQSFGTENSVSGQFGYLEQGFIDEMLADGVTELFHWTGINAWEQDFKAPEDSNWVDNVDITLYVGHGNGDGFSFEDTSHEDSKLDYNDATGDWGNKNLEWLALYSCQVLETSWGGMNIFERWKQEFDGLHLLLGFQTNASARSSFSGAFAHNMLSECSTVRKAWFDAIATDQPSDRVGVVMGPWRAGDYVTNYNDHFWMKGSVGPDIRGGDIGGFWAVTGP